MGSGMYVLLRVLACGRDSTSVRQTVRQHSPFDCGRRMVDNTVSPQWIQILIKIKASKTDPFRKGDSIYNGDADLSGVGHFGLPGSSGITVGAVLPLL